MVEWLPEGDDHPVRPDLPWLRNLTWVKIHSMQLGFGLGLLVYWSQVLGTQGLAFGLAIVVAEFILGEFQENTEYTECDHDLGAHDVREKPWYFTSVAVATYGACLLLVGVPP